MTKQEVLDKIETLFTCLKYDEEPRQKAIKLTTEIRQMIETYLGWESNDRVEQALAQQKKLIIDKLSERLDFDELLFNAGERRDELMAVIQLINKTLEETKVEETKTIITDDTAINRTIQELLAEIDDLKKTIEAVTQEKVRQELNNQSAILDAKNSQEGARQLQLAVSRLEKQLALARLQRKELRRTLRELITRFDSFDRVKSTQLSYNEFYQELENQVADSRNVLKRTKRKK